MRKLSSKQKMVIQKYYEQGKLSDYNELVEELNKINCYECLENDLDRLISDLKLIDMLGWHSKDYKQVIREFK